MNIIPKKPLEHNACSLEINPLHGGPFVYTEDVGGSSPSSPTTNFNNLAGKYEGVGRFTEPGATAIGNRRS